MRSEIITVIKSNLIREFPNIIIAQKKEIIEDQLRNDHWKDLSFSYKKEKEAEYGFIYPMLKASGELMNSFIVEVMDQENGLEFTVSNTVEYFDKINRERPILNYTEQDMDALTIAVVEIIKQSIQGINSGV